MHELLGESAALTTAVCWAFTSVFFTIAGARVGSWVVNRVRLVLGLVFIAAAHWALLGTPVPRDVEPERLFWLALSGVIGLVLGDAMLFRAFVVIGARVSSLLMALVPVIGAATAWALLGESLSPRQAAGIAVTLAGILWVVADRQRRPDPGADHGIDSAPGGSGGTAAASTPGTAAGRALTRRRQLVTGVLLGVGGAFGQAFGLVASKKGMEGDFPALSANLIRILAATLIMWLVTAAFGRARETVDKLRDRTAVLAILGGTIFGPFLGVWLSLVAVHNAPVGIASTLMALTPILILPLVRWVFKERITAGALVGTVVAVCGVLILVR